MLPSCRAKRLACSTVVLAALLALPARTRAELIDNFNDGDDAGWLHFDGLEGTPWGPTIYDASSGRYAISSAQPLPVLNYLVPTGAIWTGSIGDPWYSSGYLKALIHADNAQTNMASVMRFDVSTGDGYGFGVDVAGGFIFIARVDGGFPTLLAEADFDVVARRDYYLETHVSGPDLGAGATITLKIWAAEEPEPESPQLAAADGTYMTGGFGLLLFNEPGGPGGRLSARFDDVHFNIPEPASLLLLLLAGLMLPRRPRGRSLERPHGLALEKHNGRLPHRQP